MKYNQCLTRQTNQIQSQVFITAIPQPQSYPALVRQHRLLGCTSENAVYELNYTNRKILLNYFVPNLTWNHLSKQARTNRVLLNTI